MDANAAQLCIRCGYEMYGSNVDNHKDCLPSWRICMGLAPEVCSSFPVFPKTSISQASTVVIVPSLRVHRPNKPLLSSIWSGGEFVSSSLRLRVGLSLRELRIDSRGMIRPS